MHKNILKIFFFLIIAGWYSSAWSQTNVDLTTYYISSQGNYNQLRIATTGAIEDPCPVGSLYASLPRGELTQCFDFDGGEPVLSPVRIPVSGVWLQDGDTVYLKDSADTVNVMLGGIPVDTPTFRLTLDEDAATPDGGILAVGTRGSGNALTTSGAGTRLIWYPWAWAFRAGAVSGNRWDPVGLPPPIGANSNSIAMGLDAQASSGSGGIALGHNAIATSTSPIAIGFNAVANGDSITLGSNSVSGGGGPPEESIAIGRRAVAQSGDFSIAMGSGDVFGTTAEGDLSLAMQGATTDAAGTNSTAIGGAGITTGQSSIVIGRQSQVHGHASVAIGNNIVVGVNGSPDRSEQSTAIGNDITINIPNAATDEEFGMAVGRNIDIFAYYGIGVGNNIRIGIDGAADPGTGQHAIAFGNNITVEGDRSIGINLDGTTAQTVIEDNVMAVLGIDTFGIDTLTPESILHIHADAGERAEILLSDEDIDTGITVGTYPEISPTYIGRIAGQANFTNPDRGGLLVMGITEPPGGEYPVHLWGSHGAETPGDTPAVLFEGFKTDAGGNLIPLDDADILLRINANNPSNRRFIILGNGNVGIGFPQDVYPSYPLEVIGGIRMANYDPLLTCDTNAAGTLYTHQEWNGRGTLCFCDGTAWQKLRQPAAGGTCP